MAEFIRGILEERELVNLSPYAQKSRYTKGREKPEPECDIRTAYMRDRDRIVHCKSFRRLKDKTQVFLAPQGDHYRTRLMHTLEVSQTARTVAKCLRLNEDLTEAIALGHDLGHTPFGHAGERALNQVCPYGFHHSEQSGRLVDILEKDGKGLNLTWEVRDGILNHGTADSPSTLEGQTVRLCDKISYIHHDMDDAERAGILCEEDIPMHLRSLLGESTRERLNTFVHDIVQNSSGKDKVSMSEEIGEAMQELRSFLYRNLYTNDVAKGEEKKAQAMLSELYRYYVTHSADLPLDFRMLIDKRGEMLERVVCDYISGMTDQYSMTKFREIFIPNSWSRP
ncbi:MAG: deoxyguanosinetriphosphate triphosphohydrolase [Lachnospiraceae bacterium]|nr:deoxyguanosinetriphosphate triphosphohydrolase [Lachnospiraceae bacterium]